MSARKLIGVLILTSALGSFACSGDCTNPADCEQGFICENKKCVMRGPPPPPPPAPDVGFPPPDTGIHPDATGGGGTDAADAGVSDGPRPDGSGGDGATMDAVPVDAGTGDAGFFTTPDVGGGPGDGGTPPNEGTISIAELRTGAGTTVGEAFADFVDYSGVTYSTLENTFSTGAPGNCKVTERRRVGVSMPGGFDAAEVRIRAGQNPHNPSTITLTRASSGAYRTAQALSRGLYTVGGMVQFDIVAGAGAGTLAGTTAMVDSPADFGALTPALGTSISLSRPIMLTWQRNNLDPNGMVVLEMYDQPREVVMRCDLRDTGAVNVPEGARQTFLSRGPRAPVFLELRFDETVTRNATINGGGALPVTFRASSGVRYTTQQ